MTEPQPQTPYEPIDLSKVRTIPLSSRANKVRLADVAPPGEPGLSFSQFLERLPGQLAAKDLKAVVAAILGAHTLRKPVIWGMGAHVIKCGLSLIVIDLMRRGIITAVAMNGAGIVHDLELALIGGTSEDVAEGLGEGSFGMAEETGRLVNEAINESWESDGPAGLGQLLGRKILEIKAPYQEYSILAQAAKLGLPATVHVALGTDIVHMHPQAKGEAIGAATFHDFRLFTSIVSMLGQGGVYLNVGSAVILPEVFLKALTVARNLGHNVTDFTTVNMDMLQHYRPLQNVVHRPTGDSGKGYTLTGHHEVMVPLLAQAVLEGMG